MKQEFSPGKGNSLHETGVHSAVESVSPEHAVHADDMDVPFIVVKLEDEHDSSDAESLVDAEWMRPVESPEYDENAGQDPTSETEVSPFPTEKHSNDALPKHEYSGERGKQNVGGKACLSPDFENAGAPKNRASKRKRRGSAWTSIKRRNKQSVSTKTTSVSRFSKSQEASIQTFMESHGKELFGPNKKRVDERQSLWKDLISQINTEVSVNGQKTLTAVKKLAVVYKKAGVRPTREHKKRTSSRMCSRKETVSPLDAEELAWGSTSTHKRLFPINIHHHHPAARGQGYGTQPVGSSASGAWAPYSRFRPACISPQQAMEPPPFPYTEYDAKPQCCEKLEGTLFEVLNLCQFMCTAIQRLEEKIDSLQPNSSYMQESHLNFPIPEEVSWHRMAHSSAWAKPPPSRGSRFGLSRLNVLSSPSHVPPPDDKPPPFHTPPARRGRPRFPQSNVTRQPAHPAAPQLDRLTSGRTKQGGRKPRGRARGRVSQAGGRADQPTTGSQTQSTADQPTTGSQTQSTADQPPMGSQTQSTADQSPMVSQTRSTADQPPMGSQTRSTADQPPMGSQTRSTADQSPIGSQTHSTADQSPIGSQTRGRADQPPITNQVFAAPPSGIAVVDVLPVNVPLMGPSSTGNVKDEQLVLIGSSSRKVRISTSEYLKAFKESDPQGAMAVMLRAVFTDMVLAHSWVTWNRSGGIMQLDPNKIEAIREWLAEMFPKHDLDVRGVDWATCLGVISSVTKMLRTRMEQAVA
ncbi:uncharacterized protein si:zfos-905g2.1 isoform X2 [Conger conger]|uniref:uncharacterized protein si:zfos-905g2.1 isoform X2 n=1 Tax=Conger conger TaxID=82655 RepID=UPI002A5AB23A|nr:uncharacterized protein si:zfos-905g2.1 isoform X2 [Conger conger]